MSIEEKFAKLQRTIETVSVEARLYFDSDSIVNEQKADGSIVTEIDKHIETAIRDFITTHFPADTIVGEEEDDVVGTSKFVWHVDPIDGTDNFVRKIPFCAVSVARLGETPEDSFGIVHNPITGQTFSSIMENGAYENQKLTNLTAETIGDKYLVVVACKPSAYELQTKIARQFGRAKSFGCTALELAYLSAGRIDAYLTRGLYSYDYAAGLYLVKAAGGRISVCRNDEWFVWEGSIKELCRDHQETIFVSHPDIHDKMRTFIGPPSQW